MKLTEALTLMLAVIGSALGLYQYRETSNNDFLKPIREAQLSLYREAASAAANLATLPQKSPEWETAKNDFWRLYYGPMVIVEDSHRETNGATPPVTMEDAMLAFGDCLDNSDCVGSREMKNLALGLASTARVSLGASWGFEAPQLKGEYVRLIESYRTRRQH